MPTQPSLIHSSISWLPILAMRIAPSSAPLACVSLRPHTRYALSHPASSLVPFASPRDSSPGGRVLRAIANLYTVPESVHALTRDFSSLGQDWVGVQWSHKPETYDHASMASAVPRFHRDQSPHLPSYRL